MNRGLRARAHAWLEQDPDPDTRAELAQLLARDDEAAVADRFAGDLRFGTAGLRAELGAGPNRMNRAVVIRTAAGLASYLRDSRGAAVVVGFDARHKSDLFARDTAAVMEGAGIRAMVLPRPLPTPVLAFAVRHLGADAGVMVTASHNPRRDNGYKVYLGDGAQLAPPADADIAARIATVGPLSSVPRGEDWVTLDDEIVEAYVEAVVAGSLVPERELRIAYTALHGVGRAVLERALDRAGFPPPAVVAAQAEPDPDFPTLAFPNPEEPGALDLVRALAAETSADVALAHDPDADRLAVVSGGRMLRGDEVGGLLAEHVLRCTSGDDRLVVTTIVSSSLLHRIAAAHGVRSAETLTGFKWIVRAARPGERFVFGYEEAMGYCVAARGVIVRDKDGVSAALAVAELAASLKRRGRTLLDALDDLERRYGVHATDQLAVRAAGPAQVAALLARLRDEPPQRLGGLAVTAVEDLAQGIAELPPAEGLRLRLERSARVVVRPSGTEPKLKAYLEVVVPLAGGDLAAARAAGGDLVAARATAAATLASLRSDLQARLRPRREP